MIEKGRLRITCLVGGSKLGYGMRGTDVVKV